MTLARYELRDYLAETQYGSIYNAEDVLDDNRHVVVKIFHKHLVREELMEIFDHYQNRRVQMKTGEDFYNELLVHSNIMRAATAGIDDEKEEHDGFKYIIKLFDHYDDDEHYYMVLEVADQDIGFRAGKSSLDDIQKWFRQLILGVHVLHECGVAHRDLSTENVLLSADEDVRIIDFGTVWKENAVNQFIVTDGELVGKTEYRCPEMIQREPYDARCYDIWSCGIILLKLLIRYVPSGDEKEYKQLYGEKQDIRRLFKSQDRLRLFGSSELDNSEFLVCIDLLSKIFQPENDRLTIDEILRHDFLST